MTRTISNSDDVIDSRDVIARIEELRDERQALEDALEAARDTKDMDTSAEVADRESDLGNWNDENASELKALEALAEEASGYAPDWEYGETLIRESYFTRYTEELCEDCGYIDKNMPHWIEIDWEATARNVMMDYTAVDYDGVTYYVR